MKSIPMVFLDLFGSHPEVEYCKEEFLSWLLENNVEELDCEDIIYYYRGRLHVDLRPGIVIAIADTIARSQVHSVSFRNNELRENGPIVAEILAREGSQVRFVDLSWNALDEHGPATAEKLSREGSQVQSVNLLWGNFYGEMAVQNRSATVEKLTSKFSKIIHIVCDSNYVLTDDQFKKLKSNAFDLFFKSDHPDLDLNSLQALAAKSAFQHLLASEKPLSEVISRIGGKVNIEFLVKSLLFYNDILTFDHIREGKDNEILKQYIADSTSNVKEEQETAPNIHAIQDENSIKGYELELPQTSTLLYLKEGESKKRKRTTEVERLKSCWMTNEGEDLPLKRKRK